MSCINIFDEMKKIVADASDVPMIKGICTGFRDIDALTLGLQPSDLILVAARPSMGKTSFVLNIANYVALRLRQPIALFSLEMSTVQVARRMLCAESCVDLMECRRGNLGENELQRLIAAADRFSKAKIYVDDTPSIAVDALRSQACRIQAACGLSLIIIDCLQLMQGTSEKNCGTRQQEVSEITRSLKSLARELAVPVIVTSQLSRSVESRQSKRPIMSDLRESGSLEQDADIVMFLYRDEYYDEESKRKNIADVIIAKHRNGHTGTASLRFEKSLQKFLGLEANK